MSREILISFSDSEEIEEFFESLKNKSELYKEQSTFMVIVGEDEIIRNVLSKATFELPTSNKGYYKIKIS